MIPSPSRLLNIDNFHDWYPNQEKAVLSVLDWINGDGKFLCLDAPTGSGKSLIAILASKLSGKRTVILTVTKGLQDQVLRDFSCVGVTDVKGQNNFSCLMLPDFRADEGPCHEMLQCPYRENGCIYYQQLNRALAADIVITNYAYYMAQTRFSSGLGRVDLLIMDEAHMAFGAIESHLKISIRNGDTEPFGVRVPRDNLEWQEWQDWAVSNSGTMRRSVEQLELQVMELRDAGQPAPSSLLASFRAARSTYRKIVGLAEAKGKWVSQPVGRGFTFTPIWVSQYGEVLFGGVNKVMLMSALMSPKSASAIGIDSAAWVTVGSTFPPANTPVWHIPTARINSRVDDYGINLWVARIDQIISRRLDRKGIIFTVSYKRRDLLLQMSRYRMLMFSHGTRDVVEMVNRFKAAKPPAVLVSPSVTSGWDFPEDDCRYIVIGKIPYPDTQDPVMVARQESDKDWSSFVAMNTLVQEAGRGTRSATDKCEVFIVDDSWKWYWPKYRSYAPEWFQERVRGSLTSVPDPIVDNFTNISV